MALIFLYGSNERPPDADEMKIHRVGTAGPTSGIVAAERMRVNVGHDKGATALFLKHDNGDSENLRDGDRILVHDPTRLTGNEELRDSGIEVVDYSSSYEPIYSELVRRLASERGDALVPLIEWAIQAFRRREGGRLQPFRHRIVNRLAALRCDAEEVVELVVRGDRAGLVDLLSELEEEWEAEPDLVPLWILRGVQARLAGALRLGAEPLVTSNPFLSVETPREESDSLLRELKASGADLNAASCEAFRRLCGAVGVVPGSSTEPDTDAEDAFWVVDPGAFLERIARGLGVLAYEPEKIPEELWTVGASAGAWQALVHLGGQAEGNPASPAGAPPASRSFDEVMRQVSSAFDVIESPWVAS